MPKIKLGFYAVWSVVDGQTQPGRPFDNTVADSFLLHFGSKQDCTFIHIDYETILFVCRRARQALNDTVKKSEKELKEAQLKEAHSKKTGFVTLLLNMQINHNILSFEDLNSFIPVWSTSCGMAGVQPVPKTYRKCCVKCKMKCSNFKSTQKML